jgi:hypothetical protein
MPEYASRSAHHALTVITERADCSLVTQGWFHDKSCLVTVETGAYVGGWMDGWMDGWCRSKHRKLSMCCCLVTRMQGKIMT